MASDAGHGGYRQPANPAPVSGPGAHSARTDRGPKQYDITGGSYGSSQEFQQQQSAAPLSAPSGSPGGQAQPMPALTPMGAPSQNLGEPVTAGANAGAGPDAMQAGIETQRDEELRQKLGPALPALMRMADSPYSTTAFREQVRQLIARIS